jgi:hypothetical protein
MIKLNVGASPIWSKEECHTLDLKEREQSKASVKGDVANIPLDGYCSGLTILDTKIAL